MEYRPNRTVSYRFTIDVNNESDLNVLNTLRKSISAHNKYIKVLNIPKKHRVGNWNTLRVCVKYRRPELKINGKGYGWGGEVKKSQLPKEADIYVHERN